jgi:hypothetical protein
MRLFARIRELAEDPKRFVCVLIGTENYKEERRKTS